MARHTKKQFCEMEGIKEHVLDHWIYRHGLKVIKIGTRIYIDDDLYKNFLAAHTTTISLTEPERPPAPQELALPKACRNKGGSSILNKLRLAK